MSTTRFLHLRAAIAGLAALSAASTVTTAAAQSPSAFTAPPKLAAPRPLTLPTMVQRTLANGLKLIIVEQHEIPVLDMTLVVRTGAEADPNGKSGLASLTASLLTEGAGSYDASSLAEQIAYLAIQVNAAASFDQTAVNLHTTRATLDSALALMADVTLRPAFAEKEFTRVKNSRLTSLLQEQDRGPAMADRAFAAIVFGDAHPYGNSVAGNREAVETFTRNDVVGFWQSAYRPDNATLIIVGDISVAEAEAKARAAFGAWPRGTAPAPLAASRAPANAATAIYIVDKPKAAQSSFRIGSVGVARNTADYYPLLVMNTALGGSFTSRLNQNLRETKAYTYGANSGFAMRRQAGPFVARAEVVAAKTDSALIEFMKEIDAIRTPMPAAELGKTKRYLQLGYAEGFESTRDIAMQIAALVPYELPLTTLSRYNVGVGGVTKADVQRVAKRYLDPSRLTIVIAGDRATIEAGLKATKIAPVEIRDLRGRRLPTP
jgi:predicted Zn-dependent peptidase